MYRAYSSRDDNKNPMYYVYLLGVMAIGFIAFFLIKLRDSFSVGGGNIDRLAISYVNEIKNEILSKYVVFISKSGDTIVEIILTILIFIFFYMINKKREAFFYALNILGIALISEGLKFVIKRPRPEGKWLVQIGGYSFPSGHAVIPMFSALLIIFFILSNFRKRVLAHILSICILIYCSLIGLSRVYVGVHYISDVIGGWMIAFIWAFVVLLFYTKYNKKDTVRYI